MVFLCQCNQGKINYSSSRAGQGERMTVHTVRVSVCRCVCVWGRTAAAVNMLQSTMLWLKGNSTNLHSKQSVYRSGKQN